MGWLPWVVTDKGHDKVDMGTKRKKKNGKRESGITKKISKGKIESEEVEGDWSELLADGD